MTSIQPPAGPAPPPKRHGRSAADLPPPSGGSLRPSVRPWRPPAFPLRSPVLPEIEPEAVQHPAPTASPTAPAGPNAPRDGWRALVWTAGLAMLLALAWTGTSIPVELEVDGQRQQLRSRAGTVGDLLLEQRVEVQAGDLVMPGTETRLRRGSRVVLRSARPVRLRVDGRSIHLTSHARSAQAVLQEAGVQMGPRDGVKVNGQIWPLDRPLLARAEPPERPDRLDLRSGFMRVAEAAGLSQEEPILPEAEEDPRPPLPAAGETWELEVLRARPITLVEDGVSIEILASGETIGEGLESAGFAIRPEDELIPPADYPLEGGLRVSLRRALPFLVVTAGEEAALYARADTVGEALRAAGIPLLGRDYSVPNAEAALSPNLRVEVVRVLEDVLVQEVAIPFNTVTQPNADLPLDQTQVLQPGEDGLKTQRIAITYENGEEVDRQIEEEVVLREPVDQILAYGTQIVWRTVSTEEGPMRYWRHLRVYATSYSASRAGTPKSAPWYGRTRLGWQMRHGIVAVDPNVIPMRTELFVPGYGRGVAGDTGGGIKRYHIDLGFDDDNYESWHQWVDLYLLEPLPPERDIPWILP